MSRMTPASVSRPLAVAAGIALDRVLPEPPTAVHPVVLFGLAMARFERDLYRDDRASGLAYAVIGTTLGVAAGAVVRSAAAATCLAVAGGGLARAARRVGEALAADDLEGARALLPALVGRDPAGLDEKEISRAVVESVAENTVDAVVAPAFWGAIAGAPGALAYRAVNTLDSMVGHRSIRFANFGWASARIDDVAAWVPARLTALLVCMVRPGSVGDVRQAVRTQAPAHPSPNAGVAEAAFAAALGLRLGGHSRYGSTDELRPQLGSGRSPEVADIERAVRLSRDVAAAMATILGALGATLWWRSIR